MNFQESITILHACTKKKISGNLLNDLRISKVGYQVGQLSRTGSRKIVPQYNAP